MHIVERLLGEITASGELERQLRSQHRKWWHFWDFGDFRDAVLARAWEHRDQFRGSTAAELLAWIRRVGWSVAVDHSREQRRQATLLHRLRQLVPWTVPSLTDALETADLVEWLLAGVTPRERNLLFMKYFRQMSTTEMATALKTSVAAVHQLHRRAILKLQARLKKMSGER
jgi:RNA polymerase sigma factor (sigma-70 family)